MGCLEVVRNSILIATVTCSLSCKLDDNRIRGSVGDTSGGSVAPLTVPDTTLILSSSNDYGIFPAGGTPPYSVSLLSGGGYLDTVNLLYTAPPSGNTVKNAQVQVQDSAGATVDIDITIPPSAAVDASFQNGPLVVSGANVLELTNFFWISGGALASQDRIVQVGERAVGTTVVRWNSDGSLDTSFGGGSGYVDLPSVSAVGEVAVDANDRVILITVPGNVYRLDNEGSLDMGFGVGGEVILAGGPTLRTVLVLANGSVLVAGGMGTDFYIAKLDPTGGMDNSFGTLGVVSTAYAGGSGEEARSLSLDNSGRILASGFADIGGSADVALARYLSNGTPDGSFDGDGQLTFHVNGDEYGDHLAVDENDFIYVSIGLAATDDVALAKLTDSGAFETSFGAGGILHNGFGIFVLSITSLFIDREGKIVLATNWGSSFHIYRYDSGGNIDLNFSTDGEYEFQLSAAAGLAPHSGRTLIQDSQGRLLLAGGQKQDMSDLTHDLFVIRLFP